jgi:hypothetical protein
VEQRFVDECGWGWRTHHRLRGDAKLFSRYVEARSE